MQKKIIKIIGGILLTFAIGLVIIFFYVKRHKEEVVNFIVETVLDKHKGHISFDDITLRSWGNFTNPAFHVKNMVLLDSSAHKVNRFEAEGIYLNLYVKSLLRNKIQVKSVRIKNAKYNSIIKNENIVKIKDEIDSPPEQIRVTDIFKPYKMSFKIDYFEFDIQNIPRKKRIKFDINELSSKLLIGPDKISASLILDADVSQLGFNLDKGSYLKDSKVKGAMYPEINLASNKTHIPSFDLSINNQIFKLTADFNTSKESGFLFKILNEETDFDSTLKLLPKNIQLKLNKYKIEKTFFTHTTLEGSFAPFSNPYVNVEFNSLKNSAVIGERFKLDSLSFKGSVANRIYDDERAKTEDKKDLKLQFESVTGLYKETKFKLSNGELVSTPEEKALIKGLLVAEGAPENIISLTNAPIFTLKSGHYYLMANLEGDATSPSDLLTHSKITLEVENTDVYDKENKLSIPVKLLKINVKEDLAVLDVLKLPLSNTDHLNIHGEVSRFSSLLDNESEHSAVTSLHLKSNKLKWDDFVNIFDHPNKSFTKRKRPVYVLHDLAQKIQAKFNPSVTVNIKNFEYEAFQLTNFSTGLFFSDMNHLHLNNTSFRIGKGLVKVNSSFDFEQADKILIAAEAEASGTSEILNDIFKSDTFFFKDGEFNLHGQIYGDIFEMDSFLNALQGNLKLVNSEVFYKPSNFTIPIDLLDVKIANNLTILNALEIGVGEKDKLRFSGKLENFGAFLSPSNTHQVNTFVNLYSSRLQWDDFMNMFKKGEKEEKSISGKPLNSHIKEIIRGIHAKFNPKLGLNIDKFEYKDVLVVDNFRSGLYFDDFSNLVLEESTCSYNKASQVAFAGKIDISDSIGTYVDVDFSVFGDPLHLNEILNYNTFLLDGGQIDINAKIRGDVEQVSELVSTSSAKFRINNSALVHNPSQVSIPLSVLEINIDNNNAILKSMEVGLPSGDHIELSGELHNMASMMPGISANNERMSSKLNINSKRVEFNDFMGLFKNKVKERKENETNGKHPLKSIIRDVYDKYHPELSINLDEFIFNKLILKSFKTGFYFENENLLYLENTSFNFYQGKVALDAHFDITDSYKTDFSVGINTEKIDFEKLLVSFDYFDVPAIKEAKGIDGKVSMDTRIEGEIIDSTGIIPSSLRGTIDFSLREMELVGFDPIINVGNIVFKKKRLEDIRFGPIQSTLYFANNTVEFPLMEIQSTAFDFFVAGHMGYAEVPTNLWIAVPLSNFKSRDITNIPDKKEYIEAGKKIYIEAKTGKKDKLKYKLHLSEKKYFKERDSLSSYRTITKENRLLRKKYKRESRMERKNVKLDRRQMH